MRKQITILTLALAICALVGTMALAKGKSHTLTLNEDTMVNGTLVKKGEYRAKFNPETSEFIIKEVDNDVVVTAKAMEMPVEKKAEATSFEITHNENGVAMLKSVTFHGNRASIVLNNTIDRTVGEESIELFQLDF